jgi:Zn-dependent M32 family carboxypeptidase
VKALTNSFLNDFPLTKTRTNTIFEQTSLMFEMHVDTSNEDFFCTVIMAVIIGFFAFAWMVSFENSDMKYSYSRTEKFLMYDAVIDDPLISWYLSGN